MNTMGATSWIIIVSGIAAIVWVNWYFFFAERAAATASPNASGRQDVTITVRGGYEPATIRVKAGRPVRLTFDRQETSGCSEEIVFPDFDLRKFLPAYQRTVIELTPPTAGTYEFMCGMSMLHGRLVAE